MLHKINCICSHPKLRNCQLRTVCFSRRIGVRTPSFMLEHLHIVSDAMYLIEERKCPIIQRNRQVIGLLDEPNSHSGNRSSRYLEIGGELASPQNCAALH